MKRLVVVLIMVLLLVGCGGGSGESKEKDAPKKPGLKYENQEDVGTGTIYLSGDGGTTEDGKSLYIMYEEEDRLLQVGLEAWDFDGTKPTTIYVDGKKEDDYQLSDTQTSINLQGEMLSKGIHNVEAVQTEGDDVVFYKLMRYEVK